MKTCKYVAQVFLDRLRNTTGDYDELRLVFDRYTKTFIIRTNEKNTDKGNINIVPCQGHYLYPEYFPAGFPLEYQDTTELTTYLAAHTIDHSIVIIIIIIMQPLCPVVGRRHQHAVSKLPCIVLSSVISCRSSICPGRLSNAWPVSLVVFSCHMVSKW